MCLNLIIHLCEAFDYDVDTIVRIICIPVGTTKV